MFYVIFKIYKKKILKKDLKKNLEQNLNHESYSMLTDIYVIFMLARVLLLYSCERIPESRILCKL